MFRVLRTIPTHDLRLIVFDLDGTLIDSRKDLAESVNAMLGRFGFARQPEEQIAGYIGNGAGVLVEKSLAAAGAKPGLAEAGLAVFLDYYREHKLDHTRLYPGVQAALVMLQASLPAQMAVLTNKPVVPSRQICEALGLGPFFFEIYGGNSFATKKPDPEGLQRLMQQAGAAPHETLMIGDSDVDIRTARAATAWSIGCRFGLSPQTIDAMEREAQLDAVVDTAVEWCEVLGLPGRRDAALYAIGGVTNGL